MTRSRTLAALLAAVLIAPAVARAQTSSSTPRMTLSPAYVILKAKFGQTVTQSVTLSNQTENGFSFEMEAQDVVVKNGKRVFFRAGELPHSIAASAVFSQRAGNVDPFSNKTVEVLLTIPAQTNIRAVTVTFKNRKVTSTPGGVSLTASLGALVTLLLTDDFNLQGEAPVVHPPTASQNLTVTTKLTNTGSEPIVPQGVAAFIGSAGQLVAKVPFTSPRLLPGERLEFSAAYPGTLKAGTYRVVCTFSYEGRSLTLTGQYRST